jgi:NAD+ synthase (glutamine-hydrolysing)
MFGLVRVGAASPKLSIADCNYNKNEIIKTIEKAHSLGVQVLVFPELCITGYSCGDLFYQKTLLKSAKEALTDIVCCTKDMNMFVAVGMPWVLGNKIYNVAVAICNGEILGIVPKTHVCNEKQFSPFDFDHTIWTEEKLINKNLVFVNEKMPDLKIALAIGDSFTFDDNYTVLNEATLVLNLAADSENYISADYRRKLIEIKSSCGKLGYVYASAGVHESTQDMVFGGHTVIAENGNILAEGQLFEFEGSLVIADIDTELLIGERQKSDFKEILKNDNLSCFFELNELSDTDIKRNISKTPFMPENKEEIVGRCEKIFKIQYTALARRLKHTHSKAAVLGISGGLDSTLALLVAVKACDCLGWDRKNVIGVTMPGFGTTDRTYNNALALMSALGITQKEISIVPSLIQHLSDIGHDINNHNVAYENAQARERTQILMDLANDLNGLVVGTGDLSELALGWATYNGDHMSMYGVNAGVPKTLVRLVVDWVGQNAGFSEEITDILTDILATPISPELLPPNSQGEIDQKTEDIVGPYELHDFFLYYVVHCGFEPAKIYAYAKQAWKDVYDDETLLKWLKNFYRRFFGQQFKRSCMPDGPMVLDISLSPRGGWQMPTDACADIWLLATEKLK